MLSTIDPFYGVILSGALVAIPATIAAVRSSQTRRSVKTTNGQTNGEVVELILHELTAVKAMLTHHIKDPNAHPDLDKVEKRL